jgi:hypothetical protein
VLLLKETVLGKDHPGTLASINNLAVALRLQGNYVNSHLVRAEDDNDIPINPTGPIVRLLYRASMISYTSIPTVPDLYDSNRLSIARPLLVISRLTALASSIVLWTHRR